jgi:purine-binding chemotaxis protein CheW
VDLAVKFGRGETVASKRTCILVVEAAMGAERLTVGVLADAVNEVLDLPATEIEQAPSFGTNVRVDFLTGMGKVGKGFVLLLDADRVISASEAELAAQVAVAASAASAEGGTAAPPPAPAASQAAPAQPA